MRCVVVHNTEEHAAAGIGQEGVGFPAVNGTHLRHVLPDQDGCAIGAKQPGVLGQNVKASEYPHLVKQQKHLVARPPDVFCPHERSEHAAGHDAQPTRVGAQLFFIHAEIHCHRHVTGQFGQLEGAGGRQAPRRRTFRPRFRGLVQVREDRQELVGRLVIIAHGAEESVRNALRQ